MKKTIYNPILPLDTYIPDGEPHVFGDRIYLYGSQDRENGHRFCMEDYVVYSAPTNDLAHWTRHEAYKKTQDPRSTKDKVVDYYAPDCVQGNDGRYYLYYWATGPYVKPFGPMSVAVSNTPSGPFEYYGDIKTKDGKPLSMFLNNDPAVINDQGRIYLYYGWGLGRDFRSKILAPLYNFVQSKIFHRPIKEIKKMKGHIMDCACVELQNDMVTCADLPHSVLPSKTSAAKESAFYHHPFYEAASIRKFNQLYYLVYSSGVNNELCYATSRYPNKDFAYRGVIISNSDLGFKGNKQIHNNAGTIHGGIECIDGEYFIFYHRCTNNTDFSRQACAEKIHIQADGTIEMVEVTTQGLNQKPLPAKGTYPAAIGCDLFNPRLKAKKGNGHREDYPCVTFDGVDRYVHANSQGTVVKYKYFEYFGPTTLRIKARGNGILHAFNQEIKIDSSEWRDYSLSVVKVGIDELSLLVQKGSIDILEVSFDENSHRS